MSDSEHRVRELEEQLARELAARQSLELALRESDARFRSMARNLTEMVLAYDMNRRLTFVNPAVAYAHRLLARGYGEAAVHLLGSRRRPRPHAGLLGPPVRGPLLPRGRVPPGHQGRPDEMDGRVVGPDARRERTPGWRAGTRARCHAPAHGGGDALRLREEHYRTLFEDSPFPMWEEDFSERQGASGRAEGARRDRHPRTTCATHRADAEECVRRIRVVDVNRAAREFYGGTRDQLIGDLNRICDDAAYEVVCEEMGALADSNSTYRTEFETQTLSGETRTVTMIVSIEPSPGTGRG